MIHEYQERLLHLTGFQDTVNGFTRGWDSPSSPAPNTGVTRTYEFNISRSTASPNGFTKNVIAVNSGCSSNAPYSSFGLQPGKIHRLRLINTSETETQKFNIDSHEITIITNNFIPIQPYRTNAITLRSE